MSTSEESRLAQLRASSHQLKSSLQNIVAGLTDASRNTVGADFNKCLTAASQAEQLLARPNPATDPNYKHDLRNNFGVIRGYVELIIEETDDTVQAAICAELNGVLTLVNSVLQLLDSATGANVESATKNTIRSPQRSASEQIPAGRLLVIDDDDGSRTLLMRHLALRDHSVYGAASGQEALSILGGSEIDLIFLDLVMPEMSGLELLTRIKSDTRLRVIPVIIVSGIEDTAGVIDCIEAGADDYLHKPFNPVLLHARLRAGLQRKGWHDREQDFLHELERNHRFIRNTFGRYLSDEIVDELLESPEGLNLGGTTTGATILMADIRNFTTICEQQQPERVVSLLNNYLGVMSEVIMNHHGTVDEFIGDGILAIFGAPVNRDDDASRAIACAIDMQSAIADINARNVALQLPEISIGIGLNTGIVVAGNIGSERRSKYGVVGHPVNLTARIESYTQGGQILASEATVHSSGAEVGTGRSFSVQPKGMAERTNLLEITSIGAPYNRGLRETAPAANG